MIRATKIQITRGEGSTDLCRKPQTFEGDGCWKAAKRWLLAEGHTFPANGGYDKHDFVVTFADGEEYEGRLDCKHPTCSDPDLDVGRHVRGFLEFLGGLVRPAWMKDEHWERHLLRVNEDGQKYIDFLAEYEIPEMAS